MRVMLADGSVSTCSLSENTDLFRHVVGGYGLFGVVLEATLDIVDNAVYRTSREIIKSDDFPKYFSEVLEPNTVWRGNPAKLYGVVTPIDERAMKMGHAP